MTYLTALEKQVVEMLLAGDNAILAVLRDQSEHLGVSSREMTGVGFFTRLVVSANAASLGRGRSFKLGDVNGTADNVRNGLGFLLYIEDGLLSALEGYTYDEPWPDDLSGVTLSYSKGTARDLEKLKTLIQ
jgi:hypothetical protein